MEAELKTISRELDQAMECLSLGREEDAADHLAAISRLLESLERTIPAQSETYDQPDSLELSVA